MSTGNAGLLSWLNRTERPELKGGGELAPHPETAAQTHGWRNRLSTGNAGILP